MKGYYDGAPWLAEVRKAQKVITYRDKGRTNIYTTAYNQDPAREAYMYCCAHHGRKEQKILDVEEGTLESEK